MIIIARVARAGGSAPGPLTARPAAERARAGAAPRSAGRAVGAARAARRQGRQHTAGDGEAARTGRGSEGEAGPADVEVLQEVVERAGDGGDHWEVPPARGAGEGGRRRDERGGSAVAGARAREGEREQRAGGSVGEAGDGGPIYVDGTNARDGTIKR
jgi:hypothetical protein